jgi:lipid biosynthesis B12-binding/radical SAM protein
MKVLLISSNNATSPYPVYPLGCAVIAEALQCAGYETELFDLMPAGEDYNLLREKIHSFRPDVIGISIRNIDNVNILEEKSFLKIPSEITEIIHSEFPGTPVVLGGSGFSIMPERILDFVQADFGIAGEGEDIFIRLLKKIEAGIKPREKIYRSTSPLYNSDIHGALYSRNLVSFYSEKGSILPLQTKRGCLNHCLYCTYPFLEGRTLRCRPPEDVIRDMKFLRDEMNADYIFFTDSVFNDRSGEYLKIIEAIEKENIDLPWTAFFQPDPNLNRDLILRMSDAGLHSVELGPDAASDTTLKAIGKHFTFADVLRCNELFAAENIPVANYFMMGGPGENRRTAEEGVENIRSLTMSVSFVFLGIRILPGTPLYKVALNQKIISEDSDIINPHYYFSPEVDREWLEKYLDETLGKIKNCVYPPNSMDSGIQILRKMGYRGNLWELMIKKRKS